MQTRTIGSGVRQAKLSKLPTKQAFSTFQAPARRADSFGPSAPVPGTVAGAAEGRLAETVRLGVIRGVSYESTRGPDAPVFRGTVVLEDGKARLQTKDGTYDLVTDGEAPWNLRWSGEMMSFLGQTVTVRAQPSTAGQVLQVKEFAPGTSDQFVHGRVLVKGDGVFINVRPGKQVKVMNEQLAGLLEDWDKVAFILPGDVTYVDGKWQFHGTPESVYLLTKLNPGEGVYYADTPFERVHLTAAKNLGGVLPNEKMGQRIFVHGKLLPKPQGSTEPNRRWFEADWLGGGISPAVVAKGEAPTGGVKFSTAMTAEAPAKLARGEEVAFEPQLPELPRGTKTGAFLVGDVQQRWFEGRKLAEGPVDAQGLPHGEWREFSATPKAGGVNAAGEAPFDYVETLRGRYEHGKRVGQWTQIIDGKPANAWQWENGHLVANGHLDAQGRPNDAWTLVAKDGFRDGGEGLYSHGLKVSRWNWYAPGTTDYARAELYHPNGKLAAKGDQLGVLGDDGVVRTFRRGSWEFFSTDGASLGTVDYGKDTSVDVEQLGALGNGVTFSWDKSVPA